MENGLLKSVVDGMPLPVVLIGADERIALMNPAAEELLGMGLSGRHYVAVLRQPLLLDGIEATFRSGTAQDSRYHSSDTGRDATYRVHCAPTFDTGRGGVLVSFEDVTPVEEAGQMRRDFVANVSHELRTPLTALLGFIETLKGPARNDEAARKRFLDIMAAEAERMNRLVRDLLSLSRVEAEARVRPAKELDIIALASEAVRVMGPLADARNVSVELETAPGPVLVRADSDQLRQVFTNLIENAIKYGGGNKTVRVRVFPSDREISVRGPGVRVDVIDQGEGIDSLHVPRLTERFYRVDTHRSREMGGTGLGLAIVKHIINRHRGRMRIESTPGQGSCFSFVLPRVEPENGEDASR